MVLCVRQEGQTTAGTEHMKIRRPVLNCIKLTRWRRLLDKTDVIEDRGRARRDADIDMRSLEVGFLRQRHAAVADDEDDDKRVQTSGHRVYERSGRLIRDEGSWGTVGLPRSECHVWDDRLPNAQSGPPARANRHSFSSRPMSLIRRLRQIRRGDPERWWNRWGRQPLTMRRERGGPATYAG